MKQKNHTIPQYDGPPVFSEVLVQRMNDLFARGVLMKRLLSRAPGRQSRTGFFPELNPKELSEEEMRAHISAFDARLRAKRGIFFKTGRRYNPNGLLPRL